ncbi:hypothetical protein N7G274_003300 [Stereocaulon virgatum]|uniref:Transaldolase n=1 Tax=Stereocaulon virgatum TaxID=373712 RepID=A0ABR4AE85_9LECA
MGSYPDTVNLLEYLRSRSSVDCDCLDTQVATTLGPFVDCTSNQADAYLELLTPKRTSLLKKSAALAREILSDFTGVSYEELAVEISMVNLSLAVAPLITGVIHVMSNPLLDATPAIVDNAKRIVSLCSRLEPGFDTSRLCIKIVSTWEGLQACHQLSSIGINTLATTLFTMEQAVLAAEAGCVYVSPFVHELKAFFDETYQDEGPILGHCLQIQQYYERYSYRTRVKAAGLLTADEAMRLAGVTSLTLAPALVHTLSKSEDSKKEVEALSLFKQGSESQGQASERLSLIDDEIKFRTAFAKSEGGKGQLKTMQAIDIFRQYQIKAESLMRDEDVARSE